jgi:hypothetical protein
MTCFVGVPNCERRYWVRCEIVSVSERLCWVEQVEVTIGSFDAAFPTSRYDLKVTVGESCSLRGQR